MKRYHPKGNYTMSKQIFIANLSNHLTTEELKEYFSPYGEITHAFIAKDRETQRSRGFGFVTFSTEAAAQQAIQKMDGKKIEGRPARVMLARPLEDRLPKNEGQVTEASASVVTHQNPSANTDDGP